MAHEVHTSIEGQTGGARRAYGGRMEGAFGTMKGVYRAYRGRPGCTGVCMGHIAGKRRKRGQGSES